MKRFTRTLPISFRGELHDVELVQFSLDLDEARAELPDGLEPLDVGGHALVSMVNVDLRFMRPVFVPRAFSFSYRHIAFRLLVDDACYEEASSARGIFFVRSFTERPFLVRGADWLTNYRLRLARIDHDETGWKVADGVDRSSYSVDATDGLNDNAGIFGDWNRARSIVGALDTAWAAGTSGTLYRTRILRDHWPIRPARLKHFETSFFETARGECAFVLDQPIHYHWLTPRRVSCLD